MTQVQMFDWMIKIRNIIESKFNIKLHDKEMPGGDYDERDFFYDVDQITTLRLWHSAQGFSERAVFDLHDEFMRPDVFFPQIVLDKIRWWLKEWIKIWYWQKEFAGMKKDEIFMAMVENIEVLYIEPQKQIAGIIETPYGKREYIVTADGEANTYAEFNNWRHEWKLRTFLKLYREEISN